MSGRIEVKVCGLRSPEDAAMAVDAGAQALGFIFYPKSPRNISPQRYQEIAGELPQHPRVAVLVTPELDFIKQLQDLRFQRFQVHFPASVGQGKLEQWSETVGFDSLCLAPKIPPGNVFDESLLQYGRRLLWDSYNEDLYGGTGRTSDWDGFAQWSAARPDREWILAGGLGPDNLLEALAATKARCIDLNSGVESSPGKKDGEKLQRVREILKSAA